MSWSFGLKWFERFIIVIQFTFQFFDVARNSAPLRGTLACFLCAACLAVSFFRLGTHMRVHRMNKANKTRNRSLHVVTYVRFNDVSSSLCRGAPYMAVPYRRNSYNHPPLLRFSRCQLAQLSSFSSLSYFMYEWSIQKFYRFVSFDFACYFLPSFKHRVEKINAK